MKNIVDTMHHRACEIVQEKRRALAQGDGEAGAGKDIMSILRAFHYFIHDANRAFKGHPILSQGEHGCLQRGETARR